MPLRYGRDGGCRIIGRRGKLVLLELTITEVVIVLGLTSLGSMIHGTTGIGLGLVTGPFLLSIEPRFVPGPIVLASVIVAIRHLMAERQHIDRATLTRIVSGMPVGAGAAIGLLALIDDRSMAIAIGLLVIVTALALLNGLTLPPGPKTEIGAGAGSAFGALAAALPGPPLVMSLHDRQPPELRATVAASSVVIAIVTAGSLLAAGRFAGRELQLLALMAPAVLCGLLAARFVRPRVDQQRFRTFVLLLALAGGSSLLIRNL